MVNGSGNGNGKGITQIAKYILTPIMQSGFFGMCMLLLGFLGWMTHLQSARFDQQINMQADTNQVLEKFTEAIIDLRHAVEYTKPGGE